MPLHRSSLHGCGIAMHIISEPFVAIPSHFLAKPCHCCVYTTFFSVLLIFYISLLTHLPPIYRVLKTDTLPNCLDRFHINPRFFYVMHQNIHHHFLHRKILLLSSKTLDYCIAFNSSLILVIICLTIFSPLSHYARKELSLFSCCFFLSNAFLRHL